MTGAQPRLERDRLAELFELISALPPGQRAARVGQLAGADAALRDELLSLLAAHTAAPDFLDQLADRVLPAALQALADPIPAGTVVGRYRIVERLGSGGMGVVYRAQDLSLARPVALKFLPAHLSTDPSASARLLAEARAASALDHPGIAVIHEIGSLDPSPDGAYDGGVFIVMAYYPGETLRRKIRRGPLPVAEAVDYATQAAAALARAHESGIIHRDVKPENLIVSDRGHLRVLDFGIATRAANAASAPAGTTAYMSPEQQRGLPVDGRADIWSLGVVLYELLAGIHPFTGSEQRHAVPLERDRPHVPPQLARIVHRCMSPDPGARHDNALQLLAELRDVQSALSAEASPPIPPGIVVLPFVNHSADPGHAYLADGLTEEIITVLSRLRGLRVISRTSAMRLRETVQNPPDLARELDVGYLLEGSVLRSEAALRITARLVDARRDSCIWTRRFDGTAADAFTLLEQVSRAVADALRVRIGAAEARALAERPIADPRAYELYLRARHEAWRFTADGLDNASAFIEQALGIVGDNALLLSTLGHIVAMHAEAGIVRDDSPMDRVGAIARRVSELDAASPRGQWLEAFVALQRGDMAAAIAAGQAALDLSPDDPDTLVLLGYACAHVGRTKEALDLFLRAVQVDPLTPLTQCMPGFAAVMDGRFGDAVAPYSRQHAMAPDNPFAIVTFGWVLAYNRRFDEALHLLDEAAQRFPGTPFAGWAACLAAALRGDRHGVLAAVSPQLQAAALQSEMFARALAQCLALAGETSGALHWLDRAVSLGLLNHDFIARHDWFLGSIRGHPRFAEILQRVSAGLDAPPASRN